MSKIGSIVKCAVCGKEFVKRLAAEKYCSRECYKVSQKIKVFESNYKRSEKRAILKRNKKYEKVCVICGKPFETSQPRAKCCSGACRYEYKRIKERERKKQLPKQPKEIEIAACEWCGQEFERKSNRQVFCSKKCYEQYHSKVERERTKSTFTEYSETNKKKTVKPPTVAEIQERMKAEGYPPYAYGKYMADLYLKQQQRS